MSKRKKYLKLGQIWTRKFGQERYWAHCVFDLPRFGLFVRIHKGDNFDEAEVIFDKTPLFENHWEAAGWEFVGDSEPAGEKLGPLLEDGTNIWYFIPPVDHPWLQVPLGSTVPPELEHLVVLNTIRGPESLEERILNGDSMNSYQPAMLRKHGTGWRKVRDRMVDLPVPLVEMPAYIYLIGDVIHYMVKEMGTIGFGMARTIEGPCMIANRKYLEPAWSNKLTDADFEAIVKRCADWIADPPVDQLGQRPTPLNVRIVSDYTELPPPQW